MVKTVAQVDSPRPVVFGILTDYEKYPEWVPGCEKCSVVSNTNKSSTVEIVLNTMKRITFQLRFDAEPDQLLKFEMVSGKDLKAYSGSYRLMTATDGVGTVLITELELDAGPMAPQFMVDRMVKKTLETTSSELRQRARKAAAEAKPVEPVEKKSTGKKSSHTKLLLRVLRTEAGDQIWYSGRMFHPKA